ncbi:MAG: thiamine phosphate synthase [Candidatus Omnitrophota bacterium]|nr:thiamine phosphate synthase [Candidatus Omnitrophota bacterium]
MKSRKNLLKRSQLYLILDKTVFAGRSLESLFSKISVNGIGIIQLRDKFSAKGDVLILAKKLARRLRASDTLFIVNDYPDIAVLCGADGLHLGQEDLPISEARKILGKDKIIGISCHSLRQALEAQRQGADYIGIGPVYATATKPEYRPIGLKVLRQLKTKIKIPYFAIGDIREANIKHIVSAGATRVAVCRAILKSKNIQQTARELLSELRVK